MIPGLGRSPGERPGYPCQDSGLENSMDRGAWRATVHGVAKSPTQLSGFHFAQPPSIGLPWGLSSEGSFCRAGDSSLIPGSGRSPRGRHGNRLQYSYLQRGAWQATVHGVAKSRTRLKRLSTSETSGLLAPRRCL